MLRLEMVVGTGVFALRRLFFLMFLYFVRNFQNAHRACSTALAFNHLAEQSICNAAT